METLGLFAAAGVRVVPVEDFDLKAAWVPQARVLLIAADLTTQERHDVACSYLPRVLQPQPQAH